MSCVKNPTLPLVAALFSAAALPLSAEVTFSVSSHKSFRQVGKGFNALFLGGELVSELRDGNAVYSAGCSFPAYLPPNNGACPLGSTGYVSFGRLEEDSLDRYLSITGIAPAVIIEPDRPDLTFLRAAPRSDLQRPLYNFVDSSIGVYYNLHTSEVSEYTITRYDSLRTYRRGKKQRNRFDREIVPGVYHYSFPRLNAPNLKANVASTVFPFTDGPHEKNNKRAGLYFNTDGLKKNKQGFWMLDAHAPNTVRWSGLNVNQIVTASDKLYLSVLYISNPNNPRSAVSYTDPVTGDSPVSIFPPFQNDESLGEKPQVVLRNPLVSSYVLPPVLENGSAGVLELELVRNLKTGGITFDFSRRIFQLPIVIADRYADYAKLRFGTTKGLARILQDFDGDGFNNLTEWILDSLADDPQDVPAAPVPDLHGPETIGGMTFGTYFGFSILKKRATVPAVKYQIQRSIDNGRTWQILNSDADWLLYEDDFQLRLISRNGTNPPAGTGSHRYRVKITRR